MGRCVEDAGLVYLAFRPNFDFLTRVVSLVSQLLLPGLISCVRIDLPPGLTAPNVTAARSTAAWNRLSIRGLT